MVKLMQHFVDDERRHAINQLLGYSEERRLYNVGKLPIGKNYG